jgi:capsular polysaccharide biosynthesis protein
MQPLSPDGTSPFLVLQTLRRYWKTIMATLIIAGALAGAYVKLQSPTYTAHATVLVRPLVGNAFASDSGTVAQTATIALQTDAQIATSAAVADLVRKVIRTCRESASTAAVLTNTQLVKVSYVGPTRKVARDCARTFANEYLAYRVQLANQTIKSQSARLLAAETSTVAARDAAAKIADAKTPPANSAAASARAKAAAQVRVYNSRLTALQKEVGQLAALSTSPGSVLVHATLPRHANGIEPALIFVAALIFGLLLGALIAIWRGRRDRRIATGVSEVGLGMPVLTSVVTPKKATTGTPLPAAWCDEEFRMAAIGVLARASAHTTVAVSPISQAASSAAVGIRLARALATDGHTVVLVDVIADGPRVSDLDLGTGGPGSSDIFPIAGFDTSRVFEFEGIDVLSVDAREAGDRQSGARTRELLATLQRTADFVVVTTSPLSQSHGLGILLGVDHAVLVADHHATTYDDIAEAGTLAQRLDVTVLGLIVCREGKPPKRDLVGTKDVDGQASVKTSRSPETTRPAKSKPSGAAGKAGAASSKSLRARG